MNNSRFHGKGSKLYLKGGKFTTLPYTFFADLKILSNATPKRIYARDLSFKAQFPVSCMLNYSF